MYDEIEIVVEYVLNKHIDYLVSLHKQSVGYFFA